MSMYTYGELELFKKYYDVDAYGLTQEEEENRPGARFHPRPEEPRPITSFYGGELCAIHLFFSFFLGFFVKSICRHIFFSLSNLHDSCIEVREIQCQSISFL